MFYEVQDKFINVNAIVFINIHKENLIFNMMDHETIEIKFKTNKEARKALKNFLDNFFIEDE